MDFLELCQKRYSCKKYDGKKGLSKEKIERILEAGRLAPTAKNLQEAHIYVLQSQDALSKVDSVTPCRYGAPVVLMVTWDKNNVFTYPGGKRESGAEDATIVATHLMLAAAAEDVCSCWVNNFDPEKLKNAMNLPENEEILMLLDLGYAAEGSGPLANHSLRKDLSESVSYI